MFFVPTTPYSSPVQIKCGKCAVMKMQSILFSTLIAAALLASAPAHAGPSNGGKANRGVSALFNPGWASGPQEGGLDFQRGRFERDTGFQVAQQSRVPLSQIIASINAIEPGQQLDTQLVNENGRSIYLIRWQASRGRIMIFRVDAETGQILGRQG
jgi:hypothetical protein